MTKKTQKFSRLAPLSLEQRFQITILATRFFSFLNKEKMSEILGKEIPKGEISPFSSVDFLSFLSKTGALPESGRYLFRVNDLLNELAAKGVLTRVGPTLPPFGDDHYFFAKEFTSKELQGVLWLSRALGPQFILRQFTPVTLQLTGVTKEGDIHAGSGIAVSTNRILTCAHVVRRMKLDEKQVFCGLEVHIERVSVHGSIDVALVEVDQRLTLLPGMAFREPNISESVFTLGYPRIPFSREPALVMQSGEVTNVSIQTFQGEKVFLFSATARPGNSGGPIIASNGHIVGLVTDELFEQTHKLSVPFYAGVGYLEIQRAISDLTSELQLPAEDYE